MQIVLCKKVILISLYILITRTCRNWRTFESVTW